MHQTLDQIRSAGLVALRRRLGRAGMIRFLQQFETGRGDYVLQRRAWVDATSLSELKQSAASTSRGSRGAKRSTGTRRS